MKMSIGQRRRSLGQALAKLRVKHGKTQEFMAQELGVSRNTIANWESGTSGIGLFEAEEWMDVLNEDPIYRIRCYRNPEMYSDLNNPKDISSLKESLIKYLRSEASDLIVYQLYFLFLGEHGSDPDAVMQELTALLQMPFSIRYPIATNIRSCYSISENKLKCPNGPKPNTEIWDNAIEAGKEAGILNKDSYNIKNKSFR